MSTSRRLGRFLFALGAVTTILALLSGGTPSGADPVYNATLKPAHIGSSNPGFSTDSCPDEGWGWHFVTQGNSTDFIAVKATFQSAGVITTFTSFPTAKHAYVYTPGPDTLLAAVAEVSGPDLEFNLSHVCTGSTVTTTTEPTTTTTTEPTTTTTTEPTTTTTEPTTTTTEPTTTTTTEPPVVIDSTTSSIVESTTTTSTTEVPAEVEDTTVDRTPSNVDQGTLPRTGSTTGSLLAIGVSLLVLGALFIQRSRVLAAR